MANSEDSDDCICLTPAVRSAEKSALYRHLLHRVQSVLEHYLAEDFELLGEEKVQFTEEVTQLCVVYQFDEEQAPFHLLYGTIRQLLHKYAQKSCEQINSVAKLNEAAGNRAYLDAYHTAWLQWARRTRALVELLSHTSEVNDTVRFLNRQFASFEQRNRLLAPPASLVQRVWICHLGPIVRGPLLSCLVESLDRHRLGMYEVDEDDGGQAFHSLISSTIDIEEEGGEFSSSSSSSDHQAKEALQSRFSYKEHIIERLIEAGIAFYRRQFETSLSTTLLGPDDNLDFFDRLVELLRTLASEADLLGRPAAWLGGQLALVPLRNFVASKLVGCIEAGYLQPESAFYQKVIWPRMERVVMAAEVTPLAVLYRLSTSRRLAGRYPVKEQMKLDLNALFRKYLKVAVTASEGRLLADLAKEEAAIKKETDFARQVRFERPTTAAEALNLKKVQLTITELRAVMRHFSTLLAGCFQGREPRLEAEVFQAARRLLKPASAKRKTGDEDDENISKEDDPFDWATQLAHFLDVKLRHQIASLELIYAQPRPVYCPRYIKLLTELRCGTEALTAALESVFKYFLNDGSPANDFDDDDDDEEISCDQSKFWSLYRASLTSRIREKENEVSVINKRRHNDLELSWLGLFTEHCPSEQMVKDEVELCRRIVDEMFGVKRQQQTN